MACPAFASSMHPSLPLLADPVRTAPKRTSLERLKSQSRAPGEASFFFHDPHFGGATVKVLPGEYFVADEDLPILTTLGSCIAACLWDRSAQVGGMNHFMLPEGDDLSGRYGSYAMELLVNQMMKHGATRPGLEAKIFGGGQVISGMNTMNVGERNTRFVIDYLKAERIPVVSRDVLDIYPRKVCFLPASGKAMVKRLNASRPESLLAQEVAAARSAAQRSGGGSIDLF